MKTSVRPSLWAFFCGGPGLAPAGADPLFVALARLAERALRAPLERPQDLPDVAFVVCDPALVGDQASHPRAGPQGRREAVSFGAFEQQRRQALARRGVEQRLASGASGAAQPGRTLPEVLPPPFTDGWTSDFEPPRRLGLLVSLVEQPHRFETALLERLEIPLHTSWVAHTYIDAPANPKVS